MRVLTVVLSLWAPLSVLAQTFVVEDTVVSDPKSSLTDMEFDWVGFRITWQDKSRNLWVANVDPVTGNFLPRNGKGQRIDSSLAPMSVSNNGPEWSYGAIGTRIVYTKLVSGINYVGLARFNGTKWLAGVMSGPQTGRTPIASLDVNDATPRVRFRPGTGGNGTVWREIDSTAPAIPLPNTNGGRWIPGQRALSTVLDDTKQAAWYDIDTGVFTPISSDAGIKYDPFTFKAPEFNNDWVTIADIDHQTVGVWRQSNGVWTRINTLDVPTNQLFSLSVEPFVYNGKSYVFMVASDLPGGPSDVWIAAIDPAQPLYRQVSGSTSIVRQDPEYLITAQGVYIYYTEKTPQDIGIIHRCATGLGLPQ